MKQIILGCFGILLLLGLLVTEWSMCSMCIRAESIKQSVRRVENIVKHNVKNVEDTSQTEVETGTEEAVVEEKEGVKEREEIEKMEEKEEIEEREEIEETEKLEMIEEDEGEIEIETLELIHRIEMELEARLENTDAQYEILLSEGERKLTLHIWENIPYGVKGKRKVEMYKEIKY